MTALFTINQATKPPGVLGIARNDISLGTITVSCPSLHVSYKWEIASAPVGVAPVIATSTLATTNILLSETGSYIISLTVDASLITEQTVERVVGIVLPNMLLPIPAAWETNQDNSVSPYTGERGSADKLTAIFKWVDVNAGGGGGGGGSLQQSYNLGSTIAAILSKGPVSFSVADGQSISALSLTQNDVTNNPSALIVSNAGSGASIYLQGAGVKLIDSSALLSLSDVNRALSTFGGYLPLSDSAIDWNAYEVNYGEVSLLAAVNSAGIFQVGVGTLSSQRRNAGMTVTGYGSFATGENCSVLSDYSAAIGTDVSLADNSGTQYGIRWPNGLNFAFGEDIQIDSSLSVSTGAKNKIGTPTNPSRFSWTHGVSNITEVIKPTFIPFLQSGEGSAFTFGYQNYNASTSVCIGLSNAHLPDSTGSFTQGIMNTVGDEAWYFVPYVSSGMDMITNRSRGGTNVADVGNDTGNYEIIVKNSVLTGLEAPAGPVVIDGDVYFYYQVLDGPPRFILMPSMSPLSRDYDEDAEVLYGSIPDANYMGYAGVVCADTVGGLPYAGPTRITVGNESYYYDNFYDLPTPGGEVHGISIIDRPLDRLYVDNTLVKIGNTKYSDYIWTTDPNPRGMNYGVVGIDGDYYAYSGSGTPYPQPRFWILGGLDRPLDRDYPDGCDVHTVAQIGIKTQENLAQGGVNTCAAGNFTGAYELLVEDAIPALEAIELTASAGNLFVMFSGTYALDGFGTNIYTSGDITASVPSSGNMYVDVINNWISYSSVFYDIPSDRTYFVTGVTGYPYGTYNCMIFDSPLRVDEVLSDYEIQPNGILNIGSAYFLYESYLGHLFYITPSGAFGIDSTTVVLGEGDTIRVSKGFSVIRVNGIDEYFPAIDYTSDPTPKFILLPASVGGLGLLNNYTLGDSVEYGDYNGFSMGGIFAKNFKNISSPFDAQVPPVGVIKVGTDYYWYDSFFAGNGYCVFGGKGMVLTASYDNTTVIKTGNLKDSPYIWVMSDLTPSMFTKSVIRIDGDNYLTTGWDSAWLGMAGVDIGSAGNLLTRDYDSYAPIEFDYTCGDLNRTALGIGGSHLAAAGNNVGNSEILVQESVIAGEESHAFFASINQDGNLYEYSNVADGPPTFFLTGTLSDTYTAGDIVRFGNVTNSPVVFVKDIVQGMYPPFGSLKIDGDYYLYDGLQDTGGNGESNHYFYNIQQLTFISGLQRDYDDDALVETGNLQFSQYIWVRTDISGMFNSSGYISIDGDVYQYSGSVYIDDGFTCFYLSNPPALLRDYRSNATIKFDMYPQEVNPTPFNFTFGEGNTQIGESSASFGGGIYNSGGGNFNVGNDITNNGNNNSLFGDYCYADGSSSGNFATGAQNSFYNTSVSIASGSANNVSYSMYCAINGYNNIINGSQYSIVSGISNQISPTLGMGMQTYYSAVFGLTNIVQGGQSNIVAGQSISLSNSGTGYGEVNSNYNALFGYGHSFKGTGSVVGGYGHTFNTLFNYGAAFGLNNVTDWSQYCIIAGTGNSIAYGNQSNAVFGSGNICSGDGNLIVGTTNYGGGTNLVAAGHNNNLFSSSTGNAVFGGNNTTNRTYALVAGRYNTCGGNYSVVAGNYNTVGNFSAVFGAGNTTTNCEYSVVAGQNNTLSSKSHSAIFGCANVGSSYGLAAGYINTCGDYSAVFGASNPTATSTYSIIAGQSHVLSSKTHSAVFGSQNTGGSYGLVAGRSNTCGDYSSVFGQNNTTATSTHSIVAGWGHTLTSKTHSAVFGYGNTGATYGIVAGYGNICGANCAVFGDSNSTATSTSSIVAGGLNTLSSQSNSAVFGYNNTGGSYGLTAGRQNTSGFASVALGYNNSALSSDYVIVAGQSNTVSMCTHSAVFGFTNTGASYGIVAGSTNICGNYAAVFGNGNTASVYSVVGGSGNVDTGGWSVIGGFQNTNGASSSCMVVGRNCNNSADNVLVGGQLNVILSSAKGSIVGGLLSSVVWPYSIAHSSGSIASVAGDRLCTVDVPLTVDTTDGSWTSMMAGVLYASESLMLRNNTVYLFEILLLGTRKSGLGSAGETKSWRLDVTVRRSGTTITIDNTNKSILSDASTLPWDVQVVSYGPASTYYGIKVQVAGEVGKTVYWQAAVKAVEINTTN